MKNMEREYKRITNLVNDGAATTKQKDDLEGNMELLNSQIKVLATQKSTIAAERNSFHVQIEQVNEQIKRSLIRNPINGVVLQKYKQAGEIVAPGQTIYKIANIDKLILRAYISGEQLSQVKIGQIVTVRIDGEEDIEEHEGKVTWVSSQAEFTPKIIQTREERVNLVYAFKVEVINDGRLKIGMPGEIKF
jgi:HlyD family secretion protein